MVLSLFLSVTVLFLCGTTTHCRDTAGYATLLASQSNIFEYLKYIMHKHRTSLRFNKLSQLYSLPK